MRPDHATFLGHNDDEAFKDYARGGTSYSSYESYGNSASRSSKHTEPVVVSALQRVEPIHGDESLGLGTSTFLEGTPASRNAIQRRESESAAPEAGGLQRKKSLAQKIRGISNNKRDMVPSARITIPDGANTTTTPDLPTPGSRMNGNEKNPFFKEPEANEEILDTKKDSNKEEFVATAEPDGRPRAPSSPRRGFGERLERRATADGTGEEVPKTGGFLSRVRSLKGKKQRPERPEKPA